MKLILIIFTLCLTTVLFSNHNIDPGKIQQVISRNNQFLIKCKLSEKDWEKAYHYLVVGDIPKIEYAISQISKCLPPEGIKKLHSSFNNLSDALIRKRAVQAIGRYKTPEAELILTDMIFANLGDNAFLDIVDELKYINLIEVNGQVVQYRPYSENIVELFKKMATSPSMADNHRGAVILAIGDMKDNRFRPVILTLMKDKKEFIRNLASLIYEMSYE